MNNRRIITSKTIKPVPIPVTHTKVENKYMSKNEKRVPTFIIKKAKDIIVAKPKPKEVVIKTPMIKNYIYSGTIIYDGKYSLNPYNWSPDKPENQPDDLKWTNISPGTLVLDKNTTLYWTVLENNKLNLKPCQTIKLDMHMPKNLANFNPNECINPFLPDINNIPIGTIFIFNNTSQRFKLNSHLHLEPKSNDNLRPNQIIPISVNSFYNTQELKGLNTMVIGSSLQRPTRDGYLNLEEWFKGLIIGNDNKIGIIDSLPKLSELMPNDILDFYDPNILCNPQQQGLNPDGTIYIDNYNESRFFNFKLRVLLDNGELTAQEIKSPKSISLATVLIPMHLYIRSATLVPKSGIPIELITDECYYMDHDISTLQIDLNDTLSKLGYPYSNIKVSYADIENENHVFRFINLPDHLFGVIMSSDSKPHNRYGGSGRFYIGYSNQVGSQWYRTSLSTKIEDLSIDEIYVDGIKLDLTKKYELTNNITISELLYILNIKLPDIGYNGYSVSLWWDETNNYLYLYLSGVVNNLIPEIMFKQGPDLIPLSFT